MVSIPTAVIAGVLVGIVLGPVLWAVYAALMSMSEAVQQDVEGNEQP